MKRLLSVVMLLLAPSLAAGGELVVAAIRSKDIPPYNQAIKGFEERLTSAGLVPWIVPYDIDSDVATPAEVVEAVRRKRPALVLTLGTKATEAAVANIPDIPIVFTVILNPGLEIMRNRNVTGASMDIPFRTQFEVLRTVLPQAKTVGMLYNAGETGKVVEAAAAAAVEAGIELVAVPVPSEREVPDKLKEIIRRIDVLWMVADGKVYTPKSTEYILQYTLKHEVPFVGLSQKYVKAGALFAMSWDYTDLGAQAAELAGRIIGGAKPGDLEVTTPRKLPLILNMRSARNLGLKLPKPIIDRAEEVYE